MKSLFLALTVALSLFTVGSFTVDSPIQAKHSKISLIQSASAQDDVGSLEPVKVSEEAVSSVNAFPTVPEGDPVKSIGELFTNWKTLSPIAIGSLLILILVQATNVGWVDSFFAFFGIAHVLEWKRAIVTVLGLAYGVVVYLQSGLAWPSVVIAALSAGGAVAAYEAVKGLIKAMKKKPAVQIV